MSGSVGAARGAGVAAPERGRGPDAGEARAFGRALRDAAASGDGEAAWAALEARARSDPAGLGAALDAALGDRAAGGRGAALVERLARGELAAPELRLAGGDLLPAGVRGAYVAGGGDGASGGGTVWLDRGLAGDPEAAGRVLAEELGHHLDAALGPGDAPGDEGAVFAALALGRPLSPGALARLRAEDDRGRLADGTRAEFYEPEGATSGHAGPSGTSPSDGYSPADTPGERDGSTRGGAGPSGTGGYDEAPVTAAGRATSGASTGGPSSSGGSERHESDAGEGDRSSQNTSGGTKTKSPSDGYSPADTPGERDGSTRGGAGPSGTGGYDEAPVTAAGRAAGGVAGDGRSPEDTPGERDGSTRGGARVGAGGDGAHGYDDGPGRALAQLERARASGKDLAEVLRGDHDPGWKRHVTDQAIEAWADDARGAEHAREVAKAVAGDAGASRRLARGLSGSVARGEVEGERAEDFLRRAVALDAHEATDAFTSRGGEFGTALAGQSVRAQAAGLDALGAGALGGGDRRGAVTTFMREVEPSDINGRARTPERRAREDRARRELTQAMVGTHLPEARGAERRGAVEALDAALASPEGQRRLAGLSDMGWADQKAAVEAMTTQAAATAAAAAAAPRAAVGAPAPAPAPEARPSGSAEGRSGLPGRIGRVGRLTSPVGALVTGLGIGPAGGTERTTVPIGPDLRVTSDHDTAPSVERLEDGRWTRLHGVAAMLGQDGGPPAVDRDALRAALGGTLPPGLDVEDLPPAPPLPPARGLVPPPAPPTGEGYTPDPDAGRGDNTAGPTPPIPDDPIVTTPPDPNVIGDGVTTMDPNNSRAVRTQQEAADRMREAFPDSVVVEETEFPAMDGFKNGDIDIIVGGVPVEVTSGRGQRKLDDQLPKIENATSERPIVYAPHISGTIERNMKDADYTVVRDLDALEEAVRDRMTPDEG